MSLLPFPEPSWLPSRPKSTRGHCRHLGPDTGSTILIRCETCQGNVRKKFPVHECGLYLTCIPNLSGAGGCVGCKSFRPLPEQPRQEAGDDRPREDDAQNHG